MTRSRALRLAPVVDAPRLHRALVTAFGSINAAAAAAKVPQSTLCRLANGTSRAISPSVLRNILRASRAEGDAVTAEVKASLLSPGTMTAVTAYQRWLAKELREIEADDAVTEASIIWPDSDDLDNAMMSKTIRLMIFWGLRNDVVRHEHTRDLYQAFDRWMDRYEVEPVRQLLAVFRVLRPFLQPVAFVLGMELPLAELLADRRQARKYFRAAFEAERALLSRAPLRTRAVVVGQPIPEHEHRLSFETRRRNLGRRQPARAKA